ncbi:hypothetical protein [Nitrosopumilus adriaticus]|uniref:hypothetical protein n=1 Tax=Nitrosopumilus adriaticus TaxID=1580092 RepID=UPI00352CA78A
MKSTQLGMLAAVTFAVGMVGINFSDGTFMLQNDTTPNPVGSGVGILGHIEIIHTDNEGNILSYQQTDNTIVNDGRNCTAMLLFGYNTGCTAATPSGLGTYTVIGLGNTTNIPLASTTDLLELPNPIDDNGLSKATGTLGTFTNATGDDGTATQRISHTFTWNGGTANPIYNAGLFNATSGASSTFALKNFPSIVTMNPQDQLTVNWDITISGTADYDTAS